tara:strand:- start:496 stop:702 length:207 start_codon:yes stop_codon:yes gene_type:complete
MTTLKDMEKYLIPIPMAWDKELTTEDKITMNEQDIIQAIDNLKVLDVPRHVVAKFLIQEIRDIFGDKT